MNLSVYEKMLGVYLPIIPVVLLFGCSIPMVKTFIQNQHEFNNGKTTVLYDSISAMLADPNNYYASKIPILWIFGASIYLTSAAYELFLKNINKLQQKEVGLIKISNIIFATHFIAAIGLQSTMAITLYEDSRTHYLVASSCFLSVTVSSIIVKFVYSKYPTKLGFIKGRPTLKNGPTSFWNSHCFYRNLIMYNNVIAVVGLIAGQVIKLNKKQLGGIVFTASEVYLIYWYSVNLVVACFEIGYLMELAN
jgi:hypothetical protein